MCALTIRRAAGILALSLGLLLPLAADAGGGDPNRLIKGTWSLFVQGNVAGISPLPAPPGTHLVAVATVTFDGRGGCSSIDQVIVGGEFIPSRDEFRTTDAPGGDCVYQVNADGFGTFDVTFPGAGPTNVTFVLTNRDELHFIANNTDLGIFGGGVMRRQSKNFGSHRDDD